MSFGADLQRFADKTGEKLEDVCTTVVLDLFNGVVRDTRVDTGRLRGNWQATIGGAAFGTLESVAPGGDNRENRPINDPTGDILASVEPFAVNVLTNNLPYARVYEEKDGMIARNSARVLAAVRKAAANA